jgi:hypothetical protein
MTCQARKQVVQKTRNLLFPIGVARCALAEKHDDDHRGECPGVRGPDFVWPRGKQATPFFMVQPKG